jgi:hypothetical protein
MAKANDFLYTVKLLKAPFISDIYFILIDPLPIAYCLLPTAYCQLPIANCLLPTAYCQLPIANCLLPTANLFITIPKTQSALHNILKNCNVIIMFSKIFSIIVPVRNIPTPARFAKAPPRQLSYL